MTSSAGDHHPQRRVPPPPPPVRSKFGSTGNRGSHASSVGKSRSDRLRDTTDRVPKHIAQWARGDIDEQQRSLEMSSGGRKSSKTQPYLPIGNPVLEMPHPIDLLHGRGDRSELSMAAQQQQVQDNIVLPSPIFRERPQSRQDLGPWRSLKRRTHESAVNVNACKYGANLLDQLSGRAHTLTSRRNKAKMKHTSSKHHPPTLNGNGGGDTTANTNGGLSLDHRPHTAPNYPEVQAEATQQQGKTMNMRRPRVLLSYDESSIRDHLLPYEHAMMFEALLTTSENSMFNINRKLEARLQRLDETRQKRYQRKYSAVTEIGQQTSHVDFRKHLRAVRCKMALEATREALDMLESHPWYRQLNELLESTYQKCGHVSSGEYFLVEEVGKVLSEGKRYTKENFRKTLLRLPLEAHQLAEVQDIIYFIGWKTGMNRDEYRMWMSAFGRAQADDIIRAYDRRFHQGSANMEKMVGSGRVRSNTATSDLDSSSFSSSFTRNESMQHRPVISAAKFLQLRSVTVESEAEKEIESDFAVNAGGSFLGGGGGGGENTSSVGKWRFLRSYSTMRGVEATSPTKKDESLEASFNR